MKKGTMHKVKKTLQKSVTNLLVFSLAIALTVVVSSTQSQIELKGGVAVPQVNWNAGGG